MINREKYKDQIIKTILPRLNFGVDKKTGCIVDCGEMPECENCLFNNSFLKCINKRKEWLEQESSDSASIIDWDSVPIDTLIRITTRDGVPMVRHFAGVIGGKITYFADRRNSSDFKAIYPAKESDTVELEPDKGR